MTHFQVTFSKSLLNSDGHQFKCTQRVIDLDAIDAEVALESAKRRFEGLFRLPNWRMRADSAEVLATQSGPLVVDVLGSLRFRCPVKQRDIYSGIDMDARTLSRISDLAVQATCPFCHTKHTWHGMNGSIAPFFTNSSD